MEVEIAKPPRILTELIFVEALRSAFPFELPQPLDEDREENPLGFVIKTSY